MTSVKPKPPSGSHAKSSAPASEVGLAAQIARAEQAVINRHARVREDAIRVSAALRLSRRAVIQGAALAGAAGLAAVVAWVGYKTYRRRAKASAGDRMGEPGETAATFAAEVIALAKTASQWAIKLHREQGLAGHIFAIVRNALSPGPPGSPVDASGSAEPSGAGSAGASRKSVDGHS